MINEDDEPPRWFKILVSGAVVLVGLQLTGFTVAFGVGMLWLGLPDLLTHVLSIGEEKK